jgi:hypothetical protein
MSGYQAHSDPRQANADWMGIYLNDHLAGATAGTELARRLAVSQRSTAAGAAVAGLAREVAQDRETLLEIMSDLDVPSRAYKVALAWLGEKAARLKLNGRVAARSALSLLEELEMLRLGVEGKIVGWRTLRTVADSDSRVDAARLDRLIDRARAQADLLEELRVQAAADLIGLEQRPRVP